MSIVTETQAGIAAGNTTATLIAKDVTAVVADVKTDLADVVADVKSDTKAEAVDATEDAGKAESFFQRAEHVSYEEFEELREAFLRLYDRIDIFNKKSPHSI